MRYLQYLHICLSFGVAFSLGESTNEVLNAGREGAKRSMMFLEFKVNPYDPLARATDKFWNKVFKPIFRRLESPRRSTTQATTAPPMITSSPTYQPFVMMTSTSTTTKQPTMPSTSTKQPTMPSTSTTTIQATPSTMKVIPPSIPTTAATDRPSDPPTSSIRTETPLLTSTVISTPSAATPTSSTTLTEVPHPFSTQFTTLEASSSTSELSNAPTTSKPVPSKDMNMTITTTSTSATVTIPTSITPNSTVTPSTSQLIDCIDWLLDWLQTNSSIPLKSKWHRN